MRQLWRLVSTRRLYYPVSYVFQTVFVLQTHQF